MRRFNLLGEDRIRLPLPVSAVFTQPKFALLWLPVRLYLGYQWFSAGWMKLHYLLLRSRHMPWAPLLRQSRAARLWRSARPQPVLSHEARRQQSRHGRTRRIRRPFLT